MGVPFPPPPPPIESRIAPHEARFFFWFQRGLAGFFNLRRQAIWPDLVSMLPVSQSERTALKQDGFNK